MLDDPEQPEWFNKIMRAQSTQKRASGSASATGLASSSDIVTRPLPKKCFDGKRHRWITIKEPASWKLYDGCTGCGAKRPFHKK